MHIWLGKPIDLSRFADHEWTPQILHEATEMLMRSLTEMEAEIRGERPPEKLFSTKDAGSKDQENQ